MYKIQQYQIYDWRNNSKTFFDYRFQLVKLGNVRVWWSFQHLKRLMFFLLHIFYWAHHSFAFTAIIWLMDDCIQTSNTLTNKDILAGWRYEMILSVLSSGSHTSVIVMMIWRNCPLPFLFHFIRSFFFLKKRKWTVV